MPKTTTECTSFDTTLLGNSFSILQRVNELSKHWWYSLLRFLEQVLEVKKRSLCLVLVDERSTTVVLRDSIDIVIM